MTAQPLLLDLFCGAGGCGEGYARAGFRVVGVDLDPKPLRHNPHECYQGEALAVLDTLLAGERWQGYRLHDFAAIHASPPCQGYSITRHVVSTYGKVYPRLLDTVRAQLRCAGVPWIVENVQGAPMPGSITLCGTMFGLPLRRHRLFESSELLFAAGACRHRVGDLGIYGEGVHRLETQGTTYRDRHGKLFYRPLKGTTAEGRAAMGIDWMLLTELCQAIPPAYTEWLGRQLLAVVKDHAA